MSAMSVNEALLVMLTVNPEPPPGPIRTLVPFELPNHRFFSYWKSAKNFVEESAKTSGLVVDVIELRDTSYSWNNDGGTANMLRVKLSGIVEPSKSSSSGEAQVIPVWLNESDSGISLNSMMAFDIAPRDNVRLFKGLLHTGLSSLTWLGNSSDLVFASGAVFSRADLDVIARVPGDGEGAKDSSGPSPVPKPILNADTIHSQEKDDAANMSVGSPTSTMPTKSTENAASSKIELPLII